MNVPNPYLVPTAQKNCCVRGGTLAICHPSSVLLRRRGETADNGLSPPITIIGFTYCNLFERMKKDKLN